MITLLILYCKKCKNVLFDFVFYVQLMIFDSILINLKAFFLYLLCIIYSNKDIIYILINIYAFQ